MKYISMFTIIATLLLVSVHVLTDSHDPLVLPVASSSSRSIEMHILI